MSKKLLILGALTLITLPVFAAVQNVKVSGDIETLGIGQWVFDMNDNNIEGGEGDEEGFFATITRLRVDADLTDNVSTTVRLINERIWGQNTDASSDVDLDLAYLTLKEMFYSPLTLIIGRQELRYGSALIVGDPDTNAEVAEESGLDNQADFLSKRKAFDAIRAILDYEPWTIDLVYAKIDEVNEAEEEEDEDLYGVNIGYKFAQYDAEMEGYFFYVDGESNEDTSLIGGPPYNVDAYILGLRGSIVPVDGLTLAGEVAYQGGDYLTESTANRDLDAWAASVAGSYTFANEYEPTIRLCYDYRSGEEQADSGDYEGWIPFYEDQTKGLIADYLFSGTAVNTNSHIINLGGSIKPLEDLTISLDWFHYILDEELVPADDTPSTTIGNLSVTADKDDNFGDEIDLALTYDYSEDVQFGLKGGWFIPGDVFDTTNDDDAYEVIGSVSVSF